MRILGIDPGVTSGWCVYDAETRRVVESGQFLDHLLPLTGAKTTCKVAVLELPKGYGPTRPQLVDCAYVAGQLAQKLIHAGYELHELTRLEVCKVLTAEVHDALRVRNDATAWAALKLIHGDGSDKKGGAIYGVRAHERAALAVAVAWGLSQAVAK